MADGKLLAGNYEIIHLTVHRFKKANDQKQYPLNQQIALKPGLLKPSIPQKANLKWSAILIQAMVSNPVLQTMGSSPTISIGQQYYKQWSAEQLQTESKIQQKY